MFANAHFKKTLGRLSAAVIIVLGACVALAGCGAEQAAAPQSSVVEGDVLADHGLAGLDARQVIEKLDTMPRAERPSDLIASIRPDKIVFKDAAEREAELPMPADEFYVSFAPYVNQTHDCHFHSLTTCTGELQNAEVKVTVTDAGGEVILAAELSTYDNGFLGVWLPRDIDATLTVEYQGRTATSPITTKGDDAATCVTTLPLT